MNERNVTEQAAYIKGLAEGLELDQTTKEGKIIAALLDLVEQLSHDVVDIAEDIKEIDEDLNDLSDYVEELDDDLQAVEDFLDEEPYDEDDDEEDEDDDDDTCDGDCENCDGCDDADYFEIVCPSCGETVCFDQELDPENLVCPACGEKFGCIVDEDDYKKIKKDSKDD